MIEDIKSNISSEIQILKEISSNLKEMNSSGKDEYKLLLESNKALLESLKILNSAIPEMLRSIKLTKSLGASPEREKLGKVEYGGGNKKIKATIEEKARKKLLDSLLLNQSISKRIKRKNLRQKDEHREFKKSRGFLKLSNRLFLNTSKKLIQRGHFKSLSINLRKANIEMLFETYVSLIITSTAISFFLGIFALVALQFLDFSASWPIMAAYEGKFLTRLVKIIWIPFFLPVFTFFTMLYYPTLEKESVEKKINQEVPFAVVHMSAISGSGISPSNIFKIISLSNEYPALRKEIRKVLNQINLYGYDLVTAISNTVKSTPSKKFAELLSGISSTVRSGSDLTRFFSERSKGLLQEYRLEREKSVKMAETFMDIYISVVLAAPMILMIVFILLSLQGGGLSFTPIQMGILVSALVMIVNFIFLGFLHIKQPVY